MDAKNIYRLWCEKVKNDDLKSELLKIAFDDDEIAERFNKNLNFGTAGARGLIGVGTNRMNFVTVEGISKAFSLYLKKKNEHPSVVMSYDTRKFSYEFAKISAEVLAYYGVDVYFFETPQPIGLLSFAIKNLECSGGVMITASHNPPEYNGYKVYNSLGAQPIDTGEISDIFNKLDFFDIKKISFEEHLKLQKIKIIGEDVKTKYIEKLKSKVNFEDIDNINITYSPLNGCALDLFKSLFKNLHVVEQQKNPDFSFATCSPPDPQKINSFNLAVKLAKKNNSDVIILNDPDGDRLGIALKYQNDYKILSGIEVVALLVNCFAQKNDISNKILVKSVVTGGLSEIIANFYGAKCVDTLPGFKYIADYMYNLELNGKISSFLIGFEESNGLLPSSDVDVHDKDGVMAAAYFCDMVSYYKKMNIDCVDILNDLYKKFGYYMQKNVSFVEKDIDKIKKIISKFKKYFNLNKDRVISISDYSISEKVSFKFGEILKINLSKCDMLGIEFKDNNKLFIKASGTEPLIKFYILYSGKTQELAEKNCKKFEMLINQIYND
jgi:phosphomannomutase